MSFFDQMMANIHVPYIFFYLNKSHCIVQQDIAAKTQRIKESLSELLTHFYPITGRFKDDAVIECNDAGAEFTEARVNGFLSDLLEKPDLDSLLPLVPYELKPSNDLTIPLFYVQVTFFKCGSLALAVPTSHKFADGRTDKIYMKLLSV
ncbi:hypothetical protein L6164_037154 [Bauhinia variegata]|uniref:Uncharacterized protein n=1 Tax=Bauhinia variegata TaxID=167791 RepID=A0ACB9KJF9_BAUVA|nr:hypothetical protein L6164_037154 [Bauhinia variegata]